MSEYGSGLTIDLLSVFYYMRQIDYGNFSAGQRFHIDITEGTQVEALDITYIGQEQLDGQGEAYHISLIFTAENTGKSDSMEVWISTGEDRIPLVINGSLSVGRMECRFIDASVLNSAPGFAD